MYRIREGSIADWCISIAKVVALVGAVGFCTGIVDYL